MAAEVNSQQSDLKYPRSAFFILAGYLLERFVYYGLFGAAVFYMQRMLGYTSASAASAKAIMEGFIYLAPIAGAVLADVYLGKSRTVFWMCCGCTVGAFIYTLSSITPMMASVTAARVTGISGLIVLGMSTGLMKAVYSALGPDQFKVPEQRKEQERYFNAFYWMINAGAFTGMFMTAQLRDSVQCFGDDCYLLPYAILVAMMVLSTVIFAAGRSRYTETPPDTTLINSVKSVVYAIRKSFKKDRKPVDHWLDRASEKYDATLLGDVKSTLRLLVLFCTRPLFWALFYQTSTGMIFQAKRLDAMIGSYRIPPEMSSTINPLLIMILIPLFDLCIYPFLNRFGIMKTATSRMIVGMWFAVISFVIYSIVSMQVEQVIIPQDHSRIHIYNVLPCKVNVKLPNFDGDLQTGEMVAIPDFLTTAQSEEVVASIKPSCSAPDMSKVPVVTLGGHETTLVLSPEGAKSLPSTLDYIKSEDAEAKVRIIATIPTVENVTLQYETLKQEFQVIDGVTNFKPVSPQEYKVMLGNVSIGDSPVYQDGVYDVVITDASLFVFSMTAPSPIHMLWLFPQYLILTIGEVLFSVSGIDFAYSEAPMSMKSVLQAVDLFTITVGLWIFAGLTSLNSATGAFQHRASHEALFYAGLMAVDTIIFIILLRWYNKTPKNVDENKISNAEEDKNKLPETKAVDNKAFVEDEAL